MVAASCNGLSATTSCMVEQFGLAMMYFFEKPLAASAFTSGTTRGTSGSIRQADELSMTRQPTAPILGDHSFEMSPPADIRAMSTSRKSKWSSALHFRVRSPNETSRPIDFVDASATTSLAGNLRSARMFNISCPTLPVAPTTATRKPGIGNGPCCNGPLGSPERAAASPLFKGTSRGAVTLWPPFWRRSFSAMFSGPRGTMRRPFGNA